MHITMFLYILLTLFDDIAENYASFLYSIE